MLERKKVDLGSYVFEVIEYDPTENPRGVVTSDEWNTILGLLKSSSNYTSKTLQEVFTDLYTAHELSSTEPGASGASLIGLEPIAGLTSTLDLKGNVNEALKELVLQIKDIALGAVPPNSIGPEQLESDLDFTGNILTFNGVPVLTEDYITQSIGSDSTDKTLASSKAIYNSLTLKQDNIEVGEEAPDENTKGDIYIQLEDESIESYTKEETDLLLSTKQTTLKAGTGININGDTISVGDLSKLTSDLFVVTHTGALYTNNGHGGSKDFQQTFTKAGYYPLGVVGYTSNAVNEYNNTSMGPGLRDIYLSNRTNGSCVLRAKTHAANNQDWTYHVDFSAYILWVKVS